MAVTTLQDVEAQVQEYWSPIFTKQLRENLLLGSLIDKTYEGSIKQGGDTVKVSQIVDAEGEIRTVGVDADSFSAEALQTTQIEIKADKRAIAAYKFQDLVHIQSQIDEQDPAIMSSLNYAIQKQINNYLYSFLSPSLANPDHLINGITDFNASQFANVRTLAAQAKWLKDRGWYALLDPMYYSDVMNSQTLTSSDFGANDAPVISGNIALKRFGFNVYEDNSRQPDFGLFFHPDFLHLVTQTQARVKISDLHPLGQFGYLMSVDLIFGAARGIDSGKKHIVVNGLANGVIQ